MKKCKKTKSAVPGEIPARLRQQYNAELAEPATIIFNNIATSGVWPISWKNEYGTVLKKTPIPADESMVKIISITYQFSTLMERFIIDWLMVYIEDKLDRLAPQDCGIISFWPDSHPAAPAAHVQH